MYYILGTILGFSLLAAVFVLMVFVGASKSMEQNCRDGYENPFE
jgi:hypothetical protein